MSAAPNAETEPGEQALLSVHSASLVLLPRPLALRHGPVLATIERYAGGDVVAKLPALRLYASGSTDEGALDALGEAVFDFYEDVAPLAKADRLAGLLARQWAAFEVLVEVRG